MARSIPDVRALYGRVRRPAIQILLAGAFIVPAASFIALRDSARSDAGAADSAPGPAVIEAAEELGIGLDEKLNEALGTDNDVARAWRERALERQSRRLAGEFARRYRAYRVTDDLAAEIYRAAVLAGIEPRVAFGLVRVESSFQRTAVSHMGAVGYTQVLPSTARWMVPGASRRDLFVTRTNLEIGFQYLRYLVDKYDGDIFLALTAYNRGPGTVNRLLRQGRNPDNGYAGKVLRDRA